MKMLRANFLVVPLVFLWLGCASVGKGASALDLPIGKFVRIKGDDPNFGTSLRLPCTDNCTSTRDPETWPRAVQQLRLGIDRAIRRAASDALRQACQEVANCSPKSDEVWDRFYEISQRVQVEKNYSLDEYMSGVRTALVGGWEIDETCSEGGGLCTSMKREAEGAPEMLIETTIRAALWAEEFEVQPSFAEMIESMGDMLRKTRARGSDKLPDIDL